MSHQRRYLSVLFLALLSTITLAQDAPTVVRTWLQQRHVSLGLTAKDATNWIVTSSSTDHKGVTYLYIEQMAHGLPVHGAVASFAVRSGEVVSFGNRLRADVHGKTSAAAPTLSATDALRNAAEQLALPPSATRVLISTSTYELVLGAESLSHDPIPAHLMHEALPDGRILLASDLTIRSINHINWWHLAVDAHSGKILRNIDYIVHCDMPSTSARAYRALDGLALTPSPLAPPPDGAGYRVFPFPT